MYDTLLNDVLSALSASILLLWSGKLYTTDAH